MAVDFETPTAALFARLSDVEGIVYATRIFRSWDDVAAAEKPSLTMTSGPIDQYQADARIQGQTPPLWLLKVQVLIYTLSDDPSVASSVQLNQLIAGVCNALLRKPGETQILGAPFMAFPPGGIPTTLGGLCAYCQVSGSILREEGTIGGEAMALIPIDMVLTS